MELETMFTEQKWNILKALSNQPLSPLQLSEKLDTTMANISQQLRLLEAMNLVSKQKIKNREKGKPRALFSLTSEYAFLIPTMNQFANKRLLEVTDHHKKILKIWFVEDKAVHYSLEKLYWHIEDQLTDQDQMLYHQPTRTVYLITKNKDLQKNLISPPHLNIEVISPKSAQATIEKLNTEELVTIHGK